jgi:hypothetical protein
MALMKASPQALADRDGALPLVPHGDASPFSPVPLSSWSAPPAGSLGSCHAKGGRRGVSRQLVHEAPAKDGRPLRFIRIPGAPDRALKRGQREQPTYVGDEHRVANALAARPVAGRVVKDAELARPAPRLQPSPGGRGRCTPRRPRPRRRGPRDDRAEGVIPSWRGWRPRPRRQLGRTPRAILASVSGDAGRAASRGRGRRRGPRGHGSRSSPTLGRRRCRPRDATAASEPRRRRRRGRPAPMQAPAPPDPCANPTMRARGQASQCADRIRFGRSAIRQAGNEWITQRSARKRPRKRRRPGRRPRPRLQGPNGEGGAESGRRAARPRCCSSFRRRSPGIARKGLLSRASVR